MDNAPSAAIGKAIRKYRRAAQELEEEWTRIFGRPSSQEKDRGEPVKIANRTLCLPPMLARLLKVLGSSPGTFMDVEKLNDAIGGKRNPQSVRQLISRLRQALSNKEFDRKLIHMMHGKYCWRGPKLDVEKCATVHEHF
jgi:DNA-binding response OmpR family regulator